MSKLSKFPPILCNFEMASTSSSSSAAAASTPMQLLDLLPEIWHKIFRDFVPVHDKLHILSDMREFRKFLRDRASYLDVPLPFSVDYLELLRHIKPGFYMWKKNWSNLFYLRIDQRTLHFTLHHFLLEGCNIEREKKLRVNFYRGSFDRISKTLFSFLADYYFLEETHMLFFYFERYGFITVDFCSRYDVQRLRFYDGTQYWIYVDEPTEMKTPDQTSHCFNVTLTPQKSLVVECTLPLNICLCEERFMKLYPIDIRISEDCKSLAWDGFGEPVSSVAKQTVELGHGNHLEVKTELYETFEFKTVVHPDTERNFQQQLQKIVELDEESFP